MLNKEIQKALNEQVSVEAQASYNYLAMASWCDKSGLQGAAKFLYRQSDEERQHMLKLFKYINESGGHASTPGIKQAQADYKSIGQVFELALNQEMDNTRCINSLAEICLKYKDYSSFNFLQWFIS